MHICKMNIGFEAKRAYSNGTGLGHYSRTLISSLAQYHPEHRYFLFAPRTTGLFNASAFANIESITPQWFPATLFPALWRSNWVTKDLKKYDIDIYHGLSHEIPLGIHKTGIPSVVTIHDLIFERYPKQYNPIDVQIYRKKFQYACRHADRVIAISRQTKNDLMELYKVPESKIDICYQSCHPAFGIKVTDEEKEKIKKYYGLPDRFFLSVGSIIERKNLLTICKALLSLKTKLNIPLVVIGNGGSYKKMVQSFIASNGMEQDVIFLSDKFSNKSFTDATDFPAIYQQAIAMIYPSTFEGFGIPVLEALWSGVPVITSNVSCMPETGGDAAFYVNPLDHNQMCDAMQQVATNDFLSKEMIEKGYKHAQLFSQQRCADAVMQVYQKISNK